MVLVVEQRSLRTAKSPKEETRFLLEFELVCLVIGGESLLSPVEVGWGKRATHAETVKPRKA